MTKSLYKIWDTKIPINLFAPYSTVGQFHLWIDATCNGCDFTAELEVGKEDRKMSFKNEKDFIQSYRSQWKDYNGFMWALYQALSTQVEIFTGLNNLNKIATPLNFPLCSSFFSHRLSFVKFAQTFGKNNENLLLQTVPGWAYQLREFLCATHILLIFSKDHFNLIPSCYVTEYPVKSYAKNLTGFRETKH